MAVVECPVCLENLFDLCIVETPCQHRFCLHCFVKWTKPECPLCRRSFTKKEIPSEITDMFTKNLGSVTTRVPVRAHGVRVPQRNSATSIPNTSSVIEFPFLS